MITTLVVATAVQASPVPIANAEAVTVPEVAALPSDTVITETAPIPQADQNESEVKRGVCIWYCY
jgi:hypothetical protein